MRIYQTKDGKWHTHDCLEVTKNGYVRSERIGSVATMSDPSRDSLCKKCFSDKVTGGNK